MESIATWAGWIGTIIACLSGAGVMINKVCRMLIALQQPLKDLSSDVKGLKDDVARLSGDRLNAAYDHYVSQGWCPSAKKRQLEDWYKAYKAAGYNHLADHYLEVLIDLPEHP